MAAVNTMAWKAITRPRISSGISICTRVLLEVMCATMLIPTGTISSADSQNTRE